MTATQNEHLKQPAEDAPSDGGEIEGFRHQGFEWLDRIACKDLAPTEYFAQAGHVLGEDAKHVCFDVCEVWRECTIFSYLGYRGQMIKGGYFAGMSPGQRNKMTLTDALAYGERVRADRRSRRP